MKSLALAAWLAALCLSVFMVLDQKNSIDALSGASMDAAMPRLLKLADAVEAPPPASTDQRAPRPDVIACSRVGIFPTKEWAEKVAAILQDGPLSGAMVSPLSGMIWEVSKLGAKGYYLHFSGWDIDQLGLRVMSQRDRLKGLLSVHVVPEHCERVRSSKLPD